MCQQQFQDYWGSWFCSLPILLSQYNNILGEHESSLYLMGDEVKYWDIPIVIWKKGDVLGNCQSVSFSQRQEILEMHLEQIPKGDRYFSFWKVFLVTSEIYKLVNNTFAYSFAGKTPQDSFCTNFITVFSGKVPETTFTYNLTIQYLIELFQ